MKRSFLISAMILTCLLLAGCTTVWEPSEFDAARVRGKWRSQEISSAPPGEYSPMVDSKWVYELSVANAGAEPRLVEPVKSRQTESPALGIALTPFLMLGAFSGSGGPEYEILNQRWDAPSLTLHATQRYLKSSPPAEPEPIRITFFSGKRAELEFRGKRYRLRNDPEAFVPSYNEPIEWQK